MNDLLFRNVSESHVPTWKETKRTFAIPGRLLENSDSF